MRVFLEIPGLAELEHAHKWSEAKNLLYRLWKDDTNNVGVLCRLISECWYILAEWNCSVQNENLSADSFRKTLQEATQYGLKTFKYNTLFLWMTGYMISLFPYLFYTSDTDDLYTEWEQKGVNMLFLATQLNPKDLISKVLYYGTQPINDEYLNAKTLLSPQLINMFPGETAIEAYFKGVLSVQSTI